MLTHSHGLMALKITNRLGQYLKYILKGIVKTNGSKKFQVFFLKMLLFIKIIPYVLDNLFSTDVNG